MWFEGGNACVLQRPGPELGLKTAHLHRRLKALRQVSADAQGRALDEMTEEQVEAAGLDALERMSPEQRAASFEVIRVTVAACVKRPRIYVNPQPGQVGVDDIDEAEFWQIWKWYTDGCPDIPEPGTESAEEGVSAADADRFPAEPAGGNGVGDSGGDVRAEAVSVAGG